MLFDNLAPGSVMELIFLLTECLTELLSCCFF